MNKLILGLLMLKRLTVYEIRAIIKKNYQDMCSDSLGSIQAAMKKLLAARMVTCAEYVEKGVNKKRYSITDKVRGELMEWLQTPADMAGSKNMELGKFLFMGLVPAEKRLGLIDGIIVNLEAELSGLRGLWDAVQAQGREGVGRALEEWAGDPEYLEGILNATRNRDALESASGIGTFQAYTLRYGVDNLQFNVDWFRALRETVAGGRQSEFPNTNQEEDPS